MPTLATFNKIAVALYLASGPVITSLADQHVISPSLAVTIASIVATVGSAFHLGQTVVTHATPDAPPKHEAG